MSLLSLVCACRLEPGAVSGDGVNGFVSQFYQCLAREIRAGPFPSPLPFAA
jgi:hypothetical protein